MQHTTQNIISEIIFYTIAWVSTLFVGEWFLEVVSATCVLMIAKITDHYFREKIIAKIDRWKAKFKKKK